MQLPLKLFCSYSSKDALWRDAFLPFLKSLERRELISPWYDGMITAGSKWSEDIETALNEATAIALLISPDFVASDYCMNVEVPRAIARQEAGESLLIPILVRATPLDGLQIEQRQIIPRGLRPISNWDDPDEAWSTVTREIAAAVDAFAQSHAAPWKANGQPHRVMLEFRGLPNKILCIFGDRAEIGRSPECDIALRRAPVDVGRVHARVRFRPVTRDFVLEDLASENGTFIDDQPVKTSAVLTSGASVALGGALRFTFMQYQDGERAAGAFIYSDGMKELGRYLLAPAGQVGLGTTSADAARLPLEADGQAAGRLAITDGRLLFIPTAEGERPADLRKGTEFRALSRWIRVKEAL